MITSLALMSSCSDMLSQLSNQGIIEAQIRWEESPALHLHIDEAGGLISFRAETTHSVTYRWYLDGDLLETEQNSMLVLAEDSLDEGTHRITVVIHTEQPDVQYASAETRITIGLQLA